MLCHCLVWLQFLALNEQKLNINKWKIQSINMPKIANVPTTGCAYLIIFHYNYLYNLLRSFKCYHSGILIKEECKLSNVISSRVIYITQCCFSKLKYLHLLACYYVSYICIHRYIIYKYYLYYVNIYIYIYIYI